MRLAGYVTRMRTKRNAYRISVGTLKEKRPLGRPRHKWANNIKMDLREDGVVWTGLSWLRIRTSGGLFVNTVMNLRVPQNIGKYFSTYTTGSSQEGLISMKLVRDGLTDSVSTLRPTCCTLRQLCHLRLAYSNKTKWTRNISHVMEFWHNAAEGISAKITGRNSIWTPHWMCQKNPDRLTVNFAEITSFLQCRGYTAPNKIGQWLWTVNTEALERSIYDYFGVLSLHSSGQSEKRHKEPKSSGNPTDAMVELGSSSFWIQVQYLSAESTSSWLLTEEN
jgi:hypothetical protein